jgi:MYXO-CTERM domain-containing protein
MQVMKTRSILLGAVAVILAAPDARATNYEVGAAQQYKSPCALFLAVKLAPGDVIVVDAGKYTDACQITQSGSAATPIVMKGAPGARPVFDATGLDLSGSGSTPRAIFQFTNASHWRVEHLELTNASGSGGNGAGFRSTAGSDDVTVSDNLIHDNQDGIMNDGPGTFTIANNEIYKNGANDGYTHNLYLGGDAVRLVGNYIHDSNGGQNVKIRSHYAELLYNYVFHAGNYEIDLIQAPADTDKPNSNVVLIGNVVVRNPQAANDGQTILFGSDNPGETGRNGSLYAINNTFVMTAGTNSLVHALAPAAASKIYLFNNVIHATVAGTTIAGDAATGALVQGTNNWVTTGVTAPAGLTGSVAGADPGFVSATDLHLTSAAPARDKGTTTLSYADGAGATHDGAPQMEYANASTIGRLQDGKIDLGAFEFGTPDGGADASLPGVDAGSGDSGVSTTPVDGGGVFGNSEAGAEAGDGAAPGDGGSSGCGCRTSGDSGDAWPLFGLAGLLFLGKRRRRA